MRMQDIHLEDKEIWQQFLSYWAAGSYQTALNYLASYISQHPTFETKYFHADVINFIADFLAELQEYDDPTFKQDMIKVSETPPSGMTSGQIYFQLEA